jgi:hypothetical protein
MATEDRGDKIMFSDFQLIQSQWDRFRFYCDNGHADFVTRSRRNYRYYAGDGGQWADDDRLYMEGVQGRKCIERNGILPAVERAVGEQIATRADVAYKPSKGLATQEVAKDLTKLAMHVLDKNSYHRLEKQLYKDGLIKKRGFLRVRMDFSGNLNGEVEIKNVNPEMVVLSPYADQYDPRSWPDVMTISWLSLDEIEGLYGAEARMRADKAHAEYTEDSWAREFTHINTLDERQGFGNGAGNIYHFRTQDTGETRLRVIDRQYHKMSLCLHYVDPKTGDTKPVPENTTLMQAREYATLNGLVLQKINAKRVYWTATTRFAVLHDDWSPYETFDIIPFFYLFDYGHTLSMVDNAISPQELENKSLSALIHYMTSIANSGWKVKKGALTNMTTADLAEKGMKTGLVLELDDMSGAEKIQPNNFPTGMDRLAQIGSDGIKTCTGMSDAEQGYDSPEVSGIALRSKQYQAKLILADPHDNLAFTRSLLARKLIELFQRFFTNERMFKIIGQDDKGNTTEEELVINRVDELGQIVNDITLGEYEVTVSTQPVAATFADTQFQQLMDMMTAGIAIPPDVIVLASNLANKQQLAERMSNPDDNGAAAAQLKLLEAKIRDLMAAAGVKEEQRNKLVADKTNTNIQAMFGAVNAGKVLALTPGVAPLADELMLSAGFEDHNLPPIIPQGITALPGPVPPVPQNTSPNYPPQADHGYDAGIEGGGA